MVKKQLAVQETWVQFLGQEDLLEKRMAIHSSILAWEIPWTKELGGLQSIGLQKVGHDLATKSQPQPHTHLHLQPEAVGHQVSIHSSTHFHYQLPLLTHIAILFYLEILLDLLKSVVINFPLLKIILGLSM